MNEIEEAYLLGQQHAELLLAQHLEAAQQEEMAHMAAMEEPALVEAHLAELLEHAYLSGMAEHEAALAHSEAAHAALLEASSPPPSKEELEQEEAYQLGVMHAEAQALIREIESGSANFSDEVKKAFEKAHEDYRAATENPAPEKGSGRARGKK